MQIFYKNQEGYEEARVGRVFNHRRPERYPEVVFFPENASDVVEAVMFANENNHKIAMRAGGHSWAAWSVRDSGILLDLKHLNSISFDAQTNIVSAGPATKGGQELNPYLKAFGRMFCGGHCPSVGIGGFLLQGGQGWNTRGWGWAVEYIEAIDVVTADGQLVRADANNHADLFWAARGAGPGFFGVVTCFHLHTVPSPKALYASTYVFPSAMAEPIMNWWQAIHSTLSLNIELVLLGQTMPDNDELRITNDEFANDELRITNDEFANDELGNANDDLRITNDELRFTNDDLRITNDELRITNDEFANDELGNVNDDLRFTNENSKNQNTANSTFDIQHSTFNNVVIVHALVLEQTVEAALEALKPLAGCPYLDKALVQREYYETTFVEQLKLQTDANPENHRWVVNNAWLAGDAEQVTALMKPAFTDLPTPKTFSLWYSMAPLRTLPDIAFSLQTEIYFASYCIWEDAADDEKNKTWMHNTMQRLEPITAGQYLGDSDLTVHQRKFMADDNFEKLQTIRKKYDPNGLFHLYLTKNEESLNTNEF